MWAASLSSPPYPALLTQNPPKVTPKNQIILIFIYLSNIQFRLKKWPKCKIYPYIYFFISILVFCLGTLHGHLQPLSQIFKKLNFSIYIILSSRKCDICLKLYFSKAGLMVANPLYRVIEFDDIFDDNLTVLSRLMMGFRMRLRLRFLLKWKYLQKNWDAMTKYHFTF